MRDANIRAVKPIAFTLLAATLLVVSLPAGAQPQRPARNSHPSAALAVGDLAPDFKLKMQDGQREVQLSSFKGRRPVVLVFGSFT